MRAPSTAKQADANKEWSLGARRFPSPHSSRIPLANNAGLREDPLPSGLGRIKEAWGLSTRNQSRRARDGNAVCLPRCVIPPTGIALAM